MDTNRVELLVKEYQKRFKSKPTHAVKSCGRLEVIGNHVDYQNGYLINSSIENMCIIGVCAKRNDNVVHIESIGYPVIEFKTNEIKLNKKKDYETSKGLAKGVFKYFEKHGYKKGGFNLVMNSTLPSGVGVSSSAAFSMTVSKTLAMLYNENKNIDKVTLALASQWAENTYFGKKCGLQDQLGSCSDGMEILDFENVEKPTIHHFIPSLGNYQIILVKSQTSHANASDAFNSIPEDYIKICKKYHTKNLRTLNWNKFLTDFEKKENKSKREYMRAYHFGSELLRVGRAYRALQEFDIYEFKLCIAESGHSNKNYLQNILIPGQKTSNLLDVYDTSVRIIKNGAIRIHGGGFGGACFVIIDKRELLDYEKRIAKLVGKENIYHIDISMHALEWVKL
ncbi:MAG: hypothetical protein MJ214_02945 [Bacilli bacterium]|nr:hypothetical protein [Bacilli bacterium]